MKTRALVAAALAVLGALVFDCQPTVVLVPAVTADAGTGGGGAPSVQVVVLSDAQSAAVLSALNASEVQVAQTVMARLMNADAQAFAQRMITDHTAVNATEADLVNQQGIAPKQNAVSMALEFAAQQTIAQLQGLTGSALDTAYMVSQVQMHQQALALIDCVVMPSLTNSPMRSYVTGTVRPGLTDHLVAAESISASLSGAMASVGSGDGGTAAAQSDCSLICAPLSSGGLLTDPLQNAACIVQ
jgi:putative membrane protein